MARHRLANDTPTIETRRKLSRVVLETPGGNEFSIVYSHTWSGNLLTGVDMLEVRAAGGSTDTIFSPTTADFRAS